MLLAGAVVQKVRLAERACVVQARGGGVTRWIIVAARRDRGEAGVTSARPLGGAALGDPVSEGERTRARRLLDGATVAHIDDREALFARGDSFVRVFADRGRVALANVRLEELATLEASEPARADDEGSWLSKGAALATALAEGALDEESDALARSLKKAIARVDRRAIAVRGDLAKMDEARRLADHAAAFVAAAANAPRGARELAVTDWSTGEARTLTIAIDPSKSARAVLDARFQRAKRMKTGAAIATKRLADAEATARELAAILSLAAAAKDRAAIAALADRARRAAGKDFALQRGGGARASRTEAPRKPYRAFRGAREAAILVGRGGADNDALTSHVAKPHDLWLHAKNQKGAHVIVPLDKNKPCPPDLLADAAHLAAHFSDARDETVVEIEHTERRHLRKPRGAAPGFVVVAREKVLVLRVDRERLARLLASEEA